MKIGIIIFEQFTDIDVFLPWDIFNRIKLVGNQNDLEVRLLGTKQYHTSMAGLTIPTHGLIEEANEADAVLFSSGLGVQTVINDSSYLSRLTLNPEQQLIGSMCSGALILASLGLLEGKKATTYPTVVEQLKLFNVEVVQEPFVQQGKISTAAGCLAAQQLTAWMIGQLYGETMVKTVFDSIQPVGM